jgi:hydroxymethylpyrimidine/phosphomethylpyrimidine kinase
VSPDGPVACLTIGSTDSSGGAGVLGDVKAFASVGCFASAVVVGVTAQNTQGVVDRFTVPTRVVASQLDAVLADLRIHGVKVGSTWSAELLRYLAKRLEAAPMPVVFDPVMVTTAGASLSGDRGEVLRAIVDWMLPVATVTTPNHDEAKAILGVTRVDVTNRELAEGIVALGGRAVVVSACARDPHDWYADGTRSVAVPGVRHDVDAEHGVGCAHSSMLTGLLAWRWPLIEAAKEARRRASDGVKNGLLHLGGGRHPVDLLDLRSRVPPSSLRENRSS